MILSLLLFVSSFFTTANRGKQKSHDYSRGGQGQGGTKFRSADCVWFSSCPRTKKATLNEYKKVPSERLRSNAYENKKATIIVVASKVKEERSSEVQTASGPKCRLRLLLRISCLTRLHFKFSKISKNRHFWPKNIVFDSLT